MDDLRRTQQHSRVRQGEEGLRVTMQDNPGYGGGMVLMHRGWDVLYQCIPCALLLPRPLATVS